MVDNFAEVIVLETPLFEKADSDSKILEYKRKGDEVTIHPKHFRLDEYKMKVEPPDVSSFYQVLTSQGKVAYLLKHHARMITHDQRELDFKNPDFDETDYRIEEPLWKGYPIEPPRKVRSRLLLGFGPNTQNSYQYTERILGSNKENHIDLLFGWSKEISEESQRSFFGGMIFFRTANSSYKLQTRNSEETIFRLAVGPQINHDIFKGEEYHFNISISALFNIFNRFTVDQESSTTSEKRTFESSFITPKLGTYFNVNKIYNDFDLTIAALATFELPRDIHTSDGKSNNDWWKGNSYEREFSIQSTLMVGFTRTF